MRPQPLILLSGLLLLGAQANVILHLRKHGLSLESLVTDMNEVPGVQQQTERDCDQQTLLERQLREEVLDFAGQVQQQIFMIQATEAELDPPDMLGASSWEGDESAAMMFGQEIQNRKVGTQTFFSS